MNDLREEMAKQIDREMRGQEFVERTVGCIKIRPSFHNILMNMALLVAQRSTCVRLQVGTVISSTDFRKVLSMGYNGNATGLPNTCDRTGEAAVGNCGCVHSEANAVINCDVSRTTEKIVFATTLPCTMCSKYLINLGGVREVTYLAPYRKLDSIVLLRQAGIAVLKYDLEKDQLEPAPVPGDINRKESP